jgi:hypothetical protein
MATKGGEVKAVKAALTAGSNGAPAAAQVTPLPAKMIRNLVALGEEYRFDVLRFVAAATGPVTMADVVFELGGRVDPATLAVDWLKRRGWLTSERVPKVGGGGWNYRLSDAGRERLMALGG